MGTLAMVAGHVGGELIGADRSFDSVSTDTRSISAGQLFFALRGENFDATDFVGKAAKRGAAGAVVERHTDCDLSQVQVNNARQALGDFARVWRAQFNLPVVGVTGSNGKTTVKEMIAAVLRVTHAEAPDSILATRGNLNNDIGLPLTVLWLRPHHAAAVIEMGANSPGEIDFLAGIAAPQVGVITNAAPAHLLGFGSLDGVAASKGELFLGLPRNGSAVMNRDDDYYSYWSEHCSADKQSSFGLAEDADYRAENIRENSDPDQPQLQFTLCCPAGKLDLSLPMAGRHNVLNALAAAAAAMAAGASMEDVGRGLASIGNVAGRLHPLQTGNGLIVYDDSYNANPASVAAAIVFLASLEGSRWLVFGDMGELGEDSQHLHTEVGKLARDAGIDRLYCVGSLSRSAADAFGSGAESHESIEALWDSLQLQPGLNILVKGSRFMGLEKLVKRLTAYRGEQDSEG